MELMQALPQQHGPDDPALTDIHKLIHSCFAYMEGLIDPPSSVHQLTLAALRQQARIAQVWSYGTPPLACAIFTATPDALYIGKVAVSPKARGQGLARLLLEQANLQAKALDLKTLRLESRVELIDNHATFKALGFQEVSRSAHPGYARPTSILFERQVSHGV